MPGRKYGRRFSKRRKLYRRGRAGSLRKQVRRVARSVRKIRSMVETKQISVPFTTAMLQPPNNPSVSSAPVCWYVPAIAEGSEYNQREGKKITAKTLHLKFYTYITNPTDRVTMPDPTTRVRVMLFWDRNSSNAGTYAIGDLLEGVGSTGTDPQNYILAPLNWNNRKRFRMLMDKTYTLTSNWNPGNVTPASGYNEMPYQKSQIVSKSMHFKLNKNILYSGNADTTSSAYRNSLWLVAFCDAGKADGTVTSYTKFCFQYRMTYQDL